jgi:hypothetical protein
MFFGRSFLIRFLLKKLRVEFIKVNFIYLILEFCLSNKKKKRIEQYDLNKKEQLILFLRVRSFSNFFKGNFMCQLISN